jgi:WD40 repeat protein
LDDQGSGVNLWDVIKRTPFRKDALHIPKAVVTTGVAFGRGGKTLAAGYLGSDPKGGVIVWGGDLSTSPRSQLLPVPGPVWSVAFNPPDGKTLAASYGDQEGTDGGVILWDFAQDGSLVKRNTLLLPGSTVYQIAFAPDGETLAVATWVAAERRGRVVLWDVQRGTRLQNLSRASFNLPYHCVAFSPNGKMLAAGHDAGATANITAGVVLWDLDVESWMQLAKSIVKRDFTPDERREYLRDDER